MTTIPSFLETGDILLFNGQNYWFSSVVEWFTWSDYSHIGIVLKDPVYINKDLKGYYLLESGSEKFPDAVEHKIRFGVQIVNLQKVLDLYDGRIFYRQLITRSTSQETEGLSDKIAKVLTQIWPKIKDDSYDYNPWDLIKVESHLNVGDNRRTDRFFCSALTTFIYNLAGLFKDPEICWDLIEPRDYAPNSRIENEELIPDVQLGPLVQLETKSALKS